MATYLELYNIGLDNDYPDFRKKVVTAVMIAAQVVIDEASPTATRLAWATEAVGGPDAYIDPAVNYMLAVNNGSSIAVILAADDTGAGSIQTNVNAWRDAVYP